MQLKIPQVSIDEYLWRKLFAYIMACPREIGGLGTIEQQGDDFVITDLFLLEQKTTHARMTLDRKELRKFVEQWVLQDKDPELLRFWWHSHADGPVFWSDLDDRTIRSLAAKDDLSDKSFFVSIVGNRRGHLKTRLTVSHPVPFDLDDIPLVIMPDLETRTDLHREVEAEVAEKVQAGGYIDEAMDGFSFNDFGAYGGFIDGIMPLRPGMGYYRMMKRRAKRLAREVVNRVDERIDKAIGREGDDE